MKLRTLLFAGVLSICTLSIASAKAYEISFSSPTKVGSVKLKAGEYTLTVNGNKAVFTDTQTSKSFVTDVKVETNDKKFETTRVTSDQQGDTNVVKDIQLGGSKTKIDF